MSPRTKRSYEDWITAALGLLDEGRIPALVDLYERLDVTKGSFYSRFEDMEAFRNAVVRRWEEVRDTARLTRDVQSLRSPRERLRLIRSRFIETAVADGAVRSFARGGEKVKGSGAASDAVGRVDAAITALVTTAMLDLGFPADEATVMAKQHVSAWIGAYHNSPILPPAETDDQEYEVVLAVLTNAAAVPGSAAGREGVAVAPGAAPGEFVVYPAPADLPAAGQQTQREQAQQLAEDDRARAAVTGGAAPSRRRRRPAADAGPAT